MRAVDLFCGCGGLTKGFEKSGFEIVAAFDWWDQALDVYRSNFTHPAIKADLEQLDSNEVKKYNPEIIIGGPPCQDYSSAGKRDETAGRADRTLDFARIVTEVNTPYFVMENVEYIVKSKTLPKALKVYRDGGYGLTSITINAAFCGVPQNRKRHFVIGSLKDDDDFLLEALKKDLSKHKTTLRDYFGDSLGTEYFYRHPRSYGRRGIFSIDEPCPTVRGVNRPIPPNYQIHEGDATDDLTKVRPLTTMERARVQTFPDDFDFSSVKSKGVLEQMIGNAVPVDLAAYVARHLLQYINGVKETKIEQIKLDNFE